MILNSSALFCGRESQAPAETIDARYCKCGAKVYVFYGGKALQIFVITRETHLHILTYEGNLYFDLKYTQFQDKPSCWEWSAETGHQHFLSPLPHQPHFADIHTTWDYLQRLIKLRAFQ